VLILSIALAAVIIPGGLTWGAARRWPQADPMAPTVDTQTVKTEVRRHPWLATFVRSRLDPESAVGLVLSASLILFVGGAVGVGVLLVMIHTNTGFARFDLDTSLFAAHHATSLSTSVLRVFTQLGGADVMVPLAVIVATIETIRQRSKEVFFFLALVVGGQFLVANVTKSFVNRARPHFDMLTGFSSSSFPSGHAVAASACLAAFALVIGRQRGPRVRALLAGAAVGLATGIACTRVMLGVHWLTDVLGGLAMGWAWFALCSIAFGGRQLKFGALARSVQQARSARPSTSPRRKKPDRQPD
jgi:membrane-associated phospholipid phosphatase